MTNSHAPVPARLVSRLAWGGILAPALDVAVILGVAALQPRFNHVTQFVSELAVDGGPYASVIRGWWAIFTFVLAPFAGALWLGVRPRWLGRILAAEMLVFALLAGLCNWLFPCAAGCEPTTPEGRIHSVASGVEFISILTMPLLLGLGTRTQPGWAKTAQWSLLAFVLLLLGEGLFVAGRFFSGPIAHFAEPYMGIWQREINGVFYAWVMGLAIKFIRAPALTPEPVTTSAAPE